MKSSEQLEQETEEARARVNNTLEELRSRATPGQLVDQLIDYARGSGGGAFFNNLGRQVTDNPLPVVLLGTSIAWLAVASARPASRRYAASGSAGFSRAGERASDMAEEIGDRASDVGEQLSDRASELGDRVSERAADVRERLGERASDVRQRIGERAADVRERAAAIGERVAGAARTASDAIESIRDRASNVYDTASQSARRAVASVGQAAPAVRRNVVDKSQGFVTL